MNPSSRILSTFLFAALLAACGQDPSPTTPSSSNTEPDTALGKAVDKAIDEARSELATTNIGLDSSDGLAKAEITPKGDLLIDGQTIAIDDKQRALLLQYRKQMHAVAEAGMAIGSQSADLAGKAVGEAIGSIFSGDSNKMEKRIEAEAKGIEASAMKLCELLPGLLEAQNAVATALPAFKPYANMTPKDMEDCKADQPGDKHAETIGKAIQSAFNGKAQVKVEFDTGADVSPSAAEEAEAAGATQTK
jgi:hypothetical protein